MANDGPVFAGLSTALATPMLAGGAIDWSGLDRLLDQQMAAGIELLVVNGSTSEAATLTRDERLALLAHIKGRVAGRARLIVGTGHSATTVTIEEQQLAFAAGADASLVVTPPYNRPNRAGLKAHYQAVAAATPLPILLYNVPSRTGLDLSVGDIVELAGLPHVVGIKDANSAPDRVLRLRAALGPGFALLSGDDGTAAAYVASGGDGLISVASNAIPAAMKRLVALCREGRRAEWTPLLAKLLPLFDALASDSNPIPIKTLLAHQLGTALAFRLPLLAGEDSLRAALVRESESLGRASP